MLTGYLLEQGTTLKVQGQTLNLLRGQENLQQLMLHEIDALVLLGNVALTTGAIALLLQHRIPVSFVSLGGRFLGRLEPATSSTLDLRIAQFTQLTLPEMVRPLANQTIAAKLLNCRALLLRHTRLKYSDNNQVPHLLRVSAENALQAELTDELRGLEGQACAAYFRCFGDLLNPPWIYSGRNRQPPLDPPNALLSLGYTLLLVRCQAALQIAGLDVDLGFMHTSHHGQPALSLDFMEPFRPLLIDGLVLQALNGGLLKPDDFVASAKRPCELSPQAFKKYIQLFEERLATTFTLPGAAEPTTYGDYLHTLAQQLRQAIRNGDPTLYQPYVRR